MRKIVGIILGTLLMTASVVFADWIEPYDSGCLNDGYWGSLTVNDSSGNDVAHISGNSGMINVRDVFNDVPAPSNNGYFDVDIASETLVAATTAYTGTLITQPYDSITLKAIITYDTGVATTTITGTLTIAGYKTNGESLSESVSVSTTVAETNNAFSRITSLSWASVTIVGREDATDASLQVGPGSSLGLSNDIRTGGLISAGGDVISAMLDDSGTTTVEAAPSVNATYDTWTPGTAGDGAADVYTIKYTAVGTGK